jgi:23S rRNA pseudouridine1911/1915/1917 synthase
MVEQVKRVMIEIGDNSAGLRLDHFLARQFPQLSRVLLRRAIAGGQVLVNERRVRAGYTLRSGDTVQAEVSDTPTPALVPEPIPIRIVFEDEHLLVVEKAAGMLVYQNGKVTAGTLMNALCYHLQQVSPGARPGLIHRLDRDTSGLMVVAKTEQAHRVLSKHFRKRLVVKKYLALVHGRIVGDTFEIRLPIGWVADAFPHWQVTTAGRDAVTGICVRERFSHFTLIEVEPKTGRTHQIRIHLATLGHPIVGDQVYGREHSELFRIDEAMLDRQFLHASCLEFHHPRSGEWLTFSSPLPSELAALVEKVSDSGSGFNSGLP